MAVGCGISHTNTKTHMQYNGTIPKVHTRVCVSPITARQQLSKNPPIVARELLKNVTAATIELLDGSFYMVCVILRKVGD
jgi:hypothetical protein